jgi:hypothetical protein
MIYIYVLLFLSSYFNSTLHFDSHFLRLSFKYESRHSLPFFIVSRQQCGRYGLLQLGEDRTGANRSGSRRTITYREEACATIEVIGDQAYNQKWHTYTYISQQQVPDSPCNEKHRIFQVLMRCQVRKLKTFAPLSISRHMTRIPLVKICKITRSFIFLVIWPNGRDNTLNLAIITTFRNLSSSFWFQKPSIYGSTVLCSTLATSSVS